MFSDMTRYQASRHPVLATLALMILGPLYLAGLLLFLTVYLVAMGVIAILTAGTGRTRVEIRRGTW